MSSGPSAVSEQVREAVDWIVDWFTGLSVADCIGIGLALAALFWIWASLRAMTRLGPVIVESLEGESDTKLPVKELTAAMRERLAHGGLVPPPEVPGGAPQANVLTAIEASSVTQAAVIAQVIAAIPRPRPAEYKLGGTLFPEPPPAGAAPNAGISFWLRPTREGRELLDTISVPGNHNVAVRCAADKASLHIIEHSARVLPLWVRWGRLDAFQSYINGIEASLQGHDLEALRAFVAAAVDEPTNLLVRLKIANLDERRAGSLTPEWSRAAARAGALEQYLRVAKMQPGLVEARYRASVLAGMLASTAEAVPNTRQAVCEQLKILDDVEPGTVVATLRELAAVESNAVLQLLRPWYALLQEGRLRHQLELKGFDRRQLRRTVLISKHCLRVRKIGVDTRWRARFELWWRHLVVRYRYMAFGGGWQAHYNAASFYALLYSRARELEGDAP